MKNRTKMNVTAFAFGLLAALTWAASASHAEKPVYSKWDTGPRTIDISHYPLIQQKRYKLFAAKCSRCHTLARAINAPYTAPEWLGPVKKMAMKPGSGINKAAAKEIIAFLEYHASLRSQSASPAGPIKKSTGGQ